MRQVRFFNMIITDNATDFFNKGGFAIYIKTPRRNADHKTPAFLLNLKAKCFKNRFNFPEGGRNTPDGFNTLRIKEKAIAGLRCLACYHGFRSASAAKIYNHLGRHVKNLRDKGRINSTFETEARIAVDS